MMNVLIIRQNPDRGNIFLERRTKEANIDIAKCAESIFQPEIDALKEQGSSYPLTLLYMFLQWIAWAQDYCSEVFGRADISESLYAVLYSRQDTDIVSMCQILSNPQIRLIFVPRLLAWAFWHGLSCSNHHACNPCKTTSKYGGLHAEMDGVGERTSLLRQFFISIAVILVNMCALKCITFLFLPQNYEM